MYFFILLIGSINFFKDFIKRNCIILKYLCYDATKKHSLLISQFKLKMEILSFLSRFSFSPNIFMLY